MKSSAAALAFWAWEGIKSASGGNFGGSKKQHQRGRLGVAFGAAVLHASGPQLAGSEDAAGASGMPLWVRAGPNFLLEVTLEVPKSNTGEGVLVLLLVLQSFKLLGPNWR